MLRRDVISTVSGEILWKIPYYFHEISLFSAKDKYFLSLIGGIKIRLKISIFYGEKVVHLADF